MTQAAQSPAPDLSRQHPPQWAKYLPWLLILAIAVIYSQTLSYPFIFDGLNGILFNKSIRAFPELDPALFSNRRLMVTLTLCMNFALSGLDTTSYHVFNILVHMLNTLLLYFLLLFCLRLPDRNPANLARIPLVSADLRPLFAFAIAGLWALHPIQVQSVTYTIQRSESMAATGLLGCALAILLHDAATSFPRRVLFGLLFAFFAIVGVYSKEVALVLPFFIYLFDSRVVTGSWLQPLKARWPLYVLSLLLLILPLLSVKRSELATPVPGAQYVSAGNQPYVSSMGYFLSQPRSILHYLWISVCPANLTLDLGWYVMPPGITMVLCFIPVVALFLWAIWMLFKRPWLGFVWFGLFFVILAPSSSVMPIIDVAFEHRMYLPLLAVMISVVALLWLGVRRLAVNGAIPRESVTRSLTVAACAIMLVLAARSFIRTYDFRSEIDAWRAVTLTSPENQRAWYTVAMSHVEAGLYNDSLPYFERAHELEPQDPATLAGVALAQAKLGKSDLAALAFDAGWPTAGRVKRTYATFGAAALAFDDMPRAKKAYIEAIKFDPGNVIAHTNLGVVLARMGDKEAAFKEFQTAYDLAPEYYEQQINLAEAYQTLGNLQEAGKRYQDILKKFPAQPRTYILLSKLQMNEGDLPAARRTLESGLAIAKNNPTLLNQLIIVSILARDYKTLSAVQDALLSQFPQDVRLVHNKAWTLATCPDPAIRNPKQALMLAQAVVQATKGADLDAVQTLAAALAANGDFDNALKILQEARKAVAADPTLAQPLAQIDARIAQFERKEPYLDTTPFAGTPLEDLDTRLNPPPATQPTTGPATQPKG
jgi:protein O-mannosyl-transferase